METTVAALKRHGVERIGPTHCTGKRAVTYLAEHLPGTCFTCMAGTKVK